MPRSRSTDPVSAEHAIRERRSSRWRAGVGGLAVVAALASSALATASPSYRAAAPTVGQTAASPSPAVICGPETTLILPRRVLPGATLTGWFTGFEPNVTVTITFKPTDSTYPERAIGSTTTDEKGYGVVDVVLPGDAPTGAAEVMLVLDACAATEFPSVSLGEIVVVSALPTIRIDDDAVTPGQRVTITATGFAHDDAVDVFLDSNPLEEPESGWLATEETDSDGSVVVTIRMPREVSAGAHTLFVAGWGPEHVFPEVLSVDIFVVAGATAPPTDTG